MLDTFDITVDIAKLARQYLGRDDISSADIELSLKYGRLTISIDGEERIFLKLGDY